MNLLLDTHALLWALHDPRKLRREAAEAIQDSNRAVLYSAASVWELELKAAVGKLELPDGWLDAACASGFLELPVKAAEARDSTRLPWLHRDPFDRVIVAQALEHSLRIATRDAISPKYGVPVLLV